MAVKIRLARYGAKKNPCYRIVVADARAPRDGRFLEQIGTYQPLRPKDSPDRFQVDAERVKHWMGVGALPTATVLRYFKRDGLISA